MFHRYTCSFQYLGQFLPSKHLASMKVKLTCGSDGVPGGGIWQQGQYGGHDLLRSVIHKRKIPGKVFVANLVLYVFGYLMP